MTFNGQISFGNLLSIVTIVGGIGSGLWLAGGKVVQYEERLDHVVEAIHRLEVQGSTREEELRKLIEEEANARATAAEDLRSGIARLDDRLDALMRQKRGEAGIGNSIGVN